MRFDMARLLVERFHTAISTQLEAYAFGFSNQDRLDAPRCDPGKTLRTACWIPALIEDDATSASAGRARLLRCCIDHPLSSGVGDP
jgi:hypothetical protein